MLIIRRYQPEDKEDVKELHYAGLAQFGAEADPFYDSDLDDIDGIYINNRGEFLVGTLDGQIVAMGAFRKATDTRAEIKRIRVRRDCQRRGYGEAILQRLIERAAELGYREVCLDTVADNVPAENLFKKFGFKETRRGKTGRFDIIFYDRKIK